MIHLCQIQICKLRILFSLIDHIDILLPGQYSLIRVHIMLSHVSFRFHPDPRADAEHLNLEIIHMLLQLLHDVL